MVPGYGFVLNNSMDDFSIEGRPNGFGYEPTEANYGALRLTFPPFRR
jgi:gamma-glutamyltranspeptidase/glutathione hydrolase